MSLCGPPLVVLWVGGWIDSCICTFKKQHHSGEKKRKEPPAGDGADGAEEKEKKKSKKEKKREKEERKEKKVGHVWVMCVCVCD